MRKSTLGLFFDLIKIPFVVASPCLVANRVGDGARSGWDPHYGDPDGESIVQFAQIISGLVTFVAALLLVLIVEVARRRLRIPARQDRASLNDAT
jgi:hypothetical protein